MPCEHAVFPTSGEGDAALVGVGAAALYFSEGEIEVVGFEIDVLALPAVYIVLFGADHHFFSTVREKNFVYFVLFLQLQFKVAFAQESHLVVVLNQHLDCVFLAYHK